MAQLAACKRSENKSLEPEGTYNILGISPAAHYLTYIMGISRAPQHKRKVRIFVEKRMGASPQCSATSFSSPNK